MRLQHTTVILLTILVGLILASHELREVLSWPSPSHVIGLLIQKMTVLLMLQNLKRDKNFPSRTVIPILEPQQTLL